MMFEDLTLSCYSPMWAQSFLYPMCLVSRLEQPLGTVLFAIAPLKMCSQIKPTFMSFQELPCQTVYCIHLPLLLGLPSWNPPTPADSSLFPTYRNDNSPIGLFERNKRNLSCDSVLTAWFQDPSMCGMLMLDEWIVVSAILGLTVSFLDGWLKKREQRD